MQPVALDAPAAPVDSEGPRTILEIALDLVGAPEGGAGRLIDVPTGRGHLAVRARALGWDVRAYDIDVSRWEYDDAVPVAPADLNARLPVDDGSADVVVCCEGLEHVENPWHTLRELRRILRTGGRLVLSIPNTVDVRQRLRVLRRGYVGHYFPDVPEHVNPIGTFALAHALLRTRFSVTTIRSRKVYYPRVVAALLAPLFRFRRACGLPDEVRRLLSTPDVLFGRTAIFLARAVDR